MQTMVPLYGFGGGGGTGAALTVTAPAGCTVTVSKDGKTKTKVAGADGVAVFRGLATGQWTVTITDGEHTAQKTVTVTADYSTAITFFAATIHVTCPAGSTCTAADGVTTLTAPDTSGTWDCVVPNAGAWTFTLGSGLASVVDVINSGDTFTINRWYLYKDGTQYLPFAKYENYADYVSFENDSISFDGGTNNIPQIYTQDIDVRQFTSLNVKVSIRKNRTDGTMVFGLRDIVTGTLSSNMVASKTIVVACDSTDYSLDISGCPGDHKVAVGAWGTLVTVTEIWLEV